MPPRSQGLKNPSLKSAAAMMKTGAVHPKDYKIDISLAFSGENLYFREYDKLNI